MRERLFGDDSIWGGISDRDIAELSTDGAGAI